MSPPGLRILLLLVFFVGVCTLPAFFGPLLGNATRDETIGVPNDDPDMAAAMHKARATLPDFLAMTRTPHPEMWGFAVKVAVRDKGTTEYFWITPFAERDWGFSGRIDNVPRWVKNVKLGETIVFAKGEIVDWLYVDRGRLRGNFTLCAMVKRVAAKEAEALKKQYGPECG
jgi:uncharacterized protein YegJ (DUF2314 family)